MSEQPAVNNAGVGYPVNEVVDGNLTAVDVYGTGQYGTISMLKAVVDGVAITGVPSAGNVLTASSPTVAAWAAPAVTAQSPDWANVTLAPYTADKTGVADSTTTIQAALTAAGLAGAGVVYAPAGNYKYSRLTIPNGVTLIGDGGPDNSTNGTFFNSTATTGDSISWTSGWNISIRDIIFTGPGSGSAIGIHGNITGTSASFFINLERVQVQSFGSHGIQLQLTCVSTFTNVISKGNGGHAWYVNGILGGASGTSCTFNSCWGWNSANFAGWLIIKMTYCTWNACASDNNAAGWLIQGSQGLQFNGCGAEGIAAAGAYDGTQFKIMADSSSDVCNAIVLSACWTLSNKAVAFWVTGSSVNVVMLSPTEGTPISGATASIKVDTGSDLTVIGYDVSTAVSFATGTTNSLQSGSLSVYGTAYMSAVECYGYLYPNAGTNTAAIPSIITTPTFTSTVAKQLFTATDCMLYVDVTTSATFSMAIGPTSTPANTIVASGSLALGLVSVRIPAGWWVKMTFTGADVVFTAVIC